YTTDGWVGTVAALAQQHQPTLILTGSSFQMRDFSAALAADLGVGLVADATEVTLEGDTISAVRPSHGGNVFNTLQISAARSAVVSVRKGRFAEPAAHPGRSRATVTAALPNVEIRTTVTNVA